MLDRDAGFVLASAFLGGAWEEEPMWRRARRAYGHAPRWLRRVVREVLRAYPRPPEDRPRELAAYIAFALRGEGRAPAPSGALPAVLAAHGPQPVAGAADRHHRRAGGAVRARSGAARLA